MLKEFAFRVKSKQKVLLHSAASALPKCCFHLVGVEETSWSLLSCLLQSFLPKKACGRSVKGWKGQFYCEQQRLIPDWWIAEVRSGEQVQAGTSFVARKLSAHEALMTPQTGSGEKHTHVLPETAEEPPPDLYQDPNGSKQQRTSEINLAAPSEAALAALSQQKRKTFTNKYIHRLFCQNMSSKHKKRH